MGSEDLDNDLLTQQYEAARNARAKEATTEAAKRKVARMREYLDKVGPALDEAGEGAIEHEVELGGGDCAGWVLVKRPPRANYLSWRAKRFNPSTDRGASDRRDRADRELVEGLVVYPDPEAFGELVGRFPALYDVLAAKAIKAAEAWREEEGKG